MWFKNILKRIPGAVRFHRWWFANGYEFNPYKDLSRLSNQQLLSLMRHESHRIEKGVYNNIFVSKQNYFQHLRKKLGQLYQLLEERGYSMDEPTIIWSKKIYSAFDNLEKDFILTNSKPPPEFNPNAAQPFVEFVRARRSVRVWAEKQPEPDVLEQIAYKMIDAARWAPTSGNRQPWRFLILKSREEKESLRKIKEEHCISAPLLIFVGIDTRIYGALGKSERGIFVDAGAAIMQMVLVAHKCGLGVCWNHFADDLINSREINKKIYTDFAKAFKIADYLAPIAIIAFGIPKFIPPEPARMEIKNLMVESKSSDFYQIDNQATT